MCMLYSEKQSGVLSLTGFSTQFCGRNSLSLFSHLENMGNDPYAVTGVL